MQTATSIPISSPGTAAAARAPGQAHRLRLGALTALVVGSTIGSGIFSLPQNMASGAGAAAVLIGWIISGAGMLMLAFIYQILVPYLFSGAYALRSAWLGIGYGDRERGRNRDIAIGGLATLYCLWLLYAAGPKYLLFSALLYAPGLVLYAWARREQGLRVFRPHEAVIGVLMLTAALTAAWLLATSGLVL